MDNLKGKKILIFQQRNWAMHIGHFLAKELQEEGCRLSAITFKKTTDEFITRQKEAKYEHIINIDEIFDNPEKILNKEEISLKDICQELNIDSVWPMINSNRLLVRSYNEKFYFNFKQNLPDEFIITYIKAHYKAIRDLLEKYKPDLIFVPAFVYEGHVLLSLFADKYNIPILGVMDPRISGHYIFIHNYNSDRGPFFDHVNALNERRVETKNREKAKKYIQEFRENIKQRDTFVERAKKINSQKTIKQIVKSELSPYYHALKYYLEPRINVLKKIGPTIDDRPPRIILRDHYCRKRYEKFMKKFNYYSFDKIKKFVYFPLQIQPECSIDLTSPYFNNQIEIARQIAMSLPDDYTLVVKEHPVMVGRRPSSYIEKIYRTPNVKLVDYRISSQDILKKADLVVSPNSTTIAEAAFYRKPAIQLGNLGVTLKLPNVTKHTDMATMSKKIKELLEMNLNNDEYERKLENYIIAVYEKGFNVDYNRIWEEEDKTSLEELIKIFVNEIKNNLC